MKPLYVETNIRCRVDDLWRLTQDPACHERWDLRFTRIAFADEGGAVATGPERGAADPGASPAAGRRFRYATTVLPGLTIGGIGVTVGERARADGTCTSALRFSSNHPLSMIKAGSGYWRYVPTGEGIRFLTGYDYEPGFAFADVLFRPLLGWATAWSFDRLRLWAERGITPRRALGNALASLACRIAVVLLMAAAGPLWTAALTALALALVPPGRNTPSARRCLRLPPDRLARKAPSTLDTLELS